MVLASAWPCPSSFSSASSTWRKVCRFAGGQAQQQQVNYCTGPIKAVSALPSATVIQARISAAASTGRLDLSNCGLEEVPPQVFSLTDLVDLSLAGNNITHIQDDIQNLTSLRRLGLSGNWLSELPASIGKLKQLENLWIQGNLLEGLPKEIGDLGKLSVLALTGNMLEEIPESIGSLSNLQVLSISGNKLEQLPSGLGNLVALKVLAINGNFLKSLPISMQTLSLLEELSLQGNKIKYLPINLSGLSSLKQLSIADNELLDLPESIGELYCLESLSLYGNKIAQLPSNICSVKQLQSLWLEGNPLSVVPESLLLASNLKALGIDSLMVLPTRLQAGLGKALQISKIVGTGLASSLGGYFKLQPSTELSSREILADVVVVAFGSAPGVPNWGGLLRRVKVAMLADNKTPAFDVLYVVDSRRSWYTENKMGKEWQHIGERQEQLDRPSADGKSTGGGEMKCSELSLYYRQELQGALRDYKRVVMIGDSMGASAALLFSPLATSVIAFCPQVDLAASVIRPGRGRNWLNIFKRELLDAVMVSSAHITVHCGNWEHDLYQAKLLPNNKVDLVVHDNDNHRLAKQLDRQGSLLTIVRRKVEEEIALEHRLH